MDSSASRASVFAAQVFGVTAFVLMLVWLLHFRGGLNLNSQNKDLIFNVHPFLMFLGFIFIGGQATMVYMTIRAEKKVQKFIHMILHLIAITLGIIGFYAVFKFHNESGISNMNSLHSWLGMTTFCLYGLQVTLFCSFGYLGSFSFGSLEQQNTEGRMVHPLHRMAGVFIFLMAIYTAETGLVERFFFSSLKHEPEAHLINFTGLFIILYGFSVCFSFIR